MSDQSGFSVVLALCVIAFSVLIYFLPYLVARRRLHRDRRSILVLTLFLGWSFIGWVIALVWANSGNVEDYDGLMKARGETGGGSGVIVTCTILFAAVIGMAFYAYGRGKDENPSKVPVSDATSSTSYLANADSVSTTTQNPADAEPLATTALSLLDQYANDIEGANDRLEHRKAVVTGRLTGVFVPSLETQANLAARGHHASTFVTMGGASPLTAEESLFLPGITAYGVDQVFGADNGAVLTVGNTVTLSCTLGHASQSSTSKPTGANYPGVQVTLTDCQLVDTHREPAGEPSPAVENTGTEEPTSQAPAPIVRVSPPQADTPTDTHQQ
ncbi:MAG: superinfection immunity protein [Acidobacteriota bacterium]